MSVSKLFYPSEFKADAATDYLMMSFVRRDYTKDARGSAKYISGGYDDIVLNMPQKITERISQNYQNAGLGEMAIFDAFGNRQNMEAKFGSGLGSMLARSIENTLMDQVTKLSNQMGASGLSANGVLSGSSGIVFNPNLEVLYEGPDFRTFNFQFALATKNQKDAKSIKAIVDTLKRASLPTRDGKLTDNSGLGNLIFNTGVAGAATALGQGAFQAAGTALASKLDPSKVANYAGAATTAVKGVLGGAGMSIGAAGTGSLFFSGTNRFITQPPFLLLRYMRGANTHPFIQPLMPAAINQVSFDYTPTGNYTVLSNFATAQGKTEATTIGVTITLQLTEVTNIYSDDFNADGSYKSDHYPTTT